MLKKKINGLPVLENGKLVGVVTRHDIVEALANCGSAPGEVPRPV